MAKITLTIFFSAFPQKFWLPHILKECRKAMYCLTHFYVNFIKNVLSSYKECVLGDVVHCRCDLNIFHKTMIK